MPLLLFSGGRDSTLAAVRLALQGAPLTLLTLTHNGLTGLAAVKTRLAELASHLPIGTEWVLAKQSAELSRIDKTMPEHLGFNLVCVVTAIQIARERGLREIAFGYTRYQAHWTEQSPAAVEGLANFLLPIGLELQLPVHSLATKKAATDDLMKLGLSASALEQKSEILNTDFGAEALQREVRVWLECLRTVLDSSTLIHATITEQRQLTEERKWRPVKL